MTITIADTGVETVRPYVSADYALWWQSMAARLLEVLETARPYADEGSAYDNKWQAKLSALRSAIASAGKEKV